MIKLRLFAVLACATLAACAEFTAPFEPAATLTPPPTAEAEKNPCIITGCSSQLCVANTPDNRQIVSTCEFRPTYACYAKFGTCAVQPAGQCGWSDTPALRTCLKNPPKNKL